MFPLAVLVADEESAAAGRRDRKKSKTRSELRRAALELFAVQGYAETTVEQITDAVDVSARTFFRYFPAKDDVLFPLGPGGSSFLQSVREQPLKVDDVTAVRNACLAFLPLPPERERDTLLFKRALLSDPALEGRNLALQVQFRDQIAGALALRRGQGEPDDVSIMSAAIAQTVMHLAFDRWAAAGGRPDLVATLRDLFDRVPAVLKPPRSGGAVR
jgi:AcrR family transcriptional regulator